MWKRKLAGTVAVLGLLLGSAIPVYAGDINAEEQRIIDYYNGTVTYEGKTYYFAEWGKQKAYNKLMEDDVDLTAVQVDSAIRQANANLKRGIDEGYLVEVTENGADTQEPDTQTPDSDGKGEGTKSARRIRGRYDGCRRFPGRTDRAKAVLSGRYKFECTKAFGSGPGRRGLRRYQNQR